MSAMPMLAGPIDDLRSQIEETAFDPDLSDRARSATLLDLRARLTDLTGKIDQYLGEVVKLAQAVELSAMMKVQEARKHADLRDTLSLSDEYTPEQLDSFGLFTHEELDSLAEEGLLYEMAPLLVDRVAEIRALALEEVTGQYAEKVHPRDRLGRWREKLGIKVVPTAVGGHFKVLGPQGELAIKPTRNQAEVAADKIARRYADAAEAGKPDNVGTYLSVPRKNYPKDPDLVAKVRSKILSDAPTTRERYSVERDGIRVYDRSRQALHERIIDSMLRMDENGNPSNTLPERKPPVGRKPWVFFSGGGFAAGKSGVVKKFPPGLILLDPDKIKGQLPEYLAMQKAGDPEANLRAYEEAWDIAQATAARIQEKGLDVIVDGVGNTSAEEMLTRVQGYIDAGYDKPVAMYVTKDIEAAVAQSAKRMKKAIAKNIPESLRYIPTDLLKDVHGDVARVFPDILKAFPGDVDLFENSPIKGAAPAKHLVSKRDGKIEIIDAEGYARFLDRKRESRD